eukprot:TRINITY_DN95680_c0_g1_i1.p1 TRINITY_DN95680_c0_g1~~TRINITY_DN95680_c0_g1_i1.p1  ORF type:complete len:284 (+),score=75.12 TRINITY_DN95680_c0_g1_i1:92-853(+)
MSKVWLQAVAEKRGWSEPVPPYVPPEDEDGNPQLPPPDPLIWIDRDETEEQTRRLPKRMRHADPLFQRRVMREMGGRWYGGTVADIEYGQTSRERLYLVRYDDGDLEHWTEEKVKMYELYTRRHMKRAARGGTPLHRPVGFRKRQHMAKAHKMKMKAQSKLRWIDAKLKAGSQSKALHVEAEKARKILANHAAKEAKLAAILKERADRKAAQAAERERKKAAKKADVAKRAAERAKERERKKKEKLKLQGKKK